ncbi:TraB/GumN family protein [Alkaliphilus peptidifermentans]|uniref:Uncharacterized protein n=1 Tax=Alkaliphilus peptidifermentans DSM 18978 TaxID=1120976 RepID=A0A1G5DEH5_9FIRM|nr:hypothetical protein [Alkaliphilus peptidifermentans]SCY13152.1 hypothetical protein SAMN03080606_00886 [Alkaliphilus peptidifermentans DSM 18978]
MDYNTIIIIIGGIIVLAALITIIKSSSRDQTEVTYNTPIMGLHKIQDHETLDQERIMHEISNMRSDILQVKNDILNLFELYNKNNKTNTLGNIVVDEEEPFNQTLNYNMFIQRNNNIIQLYQEGDTPDVIARKLNKSVREVEMVIKLVK